MSRSYECIVVGGGLAGLTSMAYLRKNGISALLLEKREKLGGLVETFWHQGFAFDAGIRAFENSGIVFPMLKDLGIDFSFVKNEVSIGIGKESMALQGKESLVQYEAMLARLFPMERESIGRIMAEIRKVMGYMDVLYGIDNPLFLEKMDPLYLRKTLLPWFMKYQVNIRKASKLQEPIGEYLRRFTENQALIDVIIQHFFEDTPAFFALSYFSLYLDYTYPLGGTGKLPEKMAEYIREKKGEMRTGTGVVKVDPESHTVTLEDGEVIAYEKLIWAADQRAFYAMTEGAFGEKFQAQKRLVERSRGGDTILTVFLGVEKDRTYFQERCGSHRFHTPSLEGLSTVSFSANVGEAKDKELFRYTEEYLEKTTYEMSCPSLRDPSLAPPGCTGLVVSTLFSYDVVKRMKDLGVYEGFKEFSVKTILRVLEESIFPGFQEKVRFSLCATPLTMEKETHNYQGAITGWAFTNPTMPSEDRFKKIANSVKTPLADVYQCGQWTFSPSGLPVSILTGKLAADQVKKKR
ncbi:phytoene desaturase family protein [Proteiniclasticum ruminis]|uniref:Phytoene dehydrogenase-related protein n=1 Tax=Proteiniclasticum ruminis TaxID=398199 RepID=A0A1I5DZS1_9CLOT|nr:NAD(P)/FAD-dependent oxidoreductase [Proteiniclasticum ruminis]SFO04580.1 Phytoene dehydrogenase-related protein [Proteiniclasticum ruminis]